MGEDKHRIPYGKVEVECRDCKAIYLITQKELRRRSRQCDGYYPCGKCGSHNTTWEFGLERF